MHNTLFIVWYNTKEVRYPNTGSYIFIEYVKGKTGVFFLYRARKS